MRDTKRRLEVFSFYDHTGITAHLEKMAQKGWKLERITNLGWIYRRITPGPLRAAVSYYPRASEFDPEPSEQQRLFWDFCEHFGWELAASSAQMQIFYNERENPVPIETDAALEVENIHRAVKKGFLPAYILLLLVFAFQLFLVVQRVRWDFIGFFSNATNLFTAFNWMVLGLLCLTEVAGYLLWHKKAVRAARQGVFVPTHGRQRFAAAVLALIGTGTVCWVFSVREWHERIIGLLGILYVILLILFVNGIKKLLKRNGVSAGVNRTVTVLACLLLSFVMTGALTAFVISGLRNGFFEKKASEAYTYEGMAFSVSHDRLPLIVEELTEIAYDGYSTEWKVQESPFLAQYEAYQHSRLDKPESPGLRYTVTKVKLPAMYQWCFRQLFGRYDRWQERQPEEYREHYVKIDASPWKADAAYQMYTGEAPWNTYLICWEESIVEFTADWAMTPEQMGIAGEKLKGL